MNILDEFEEEQVNYTILKVEAQIEAKTQVEVMEETITSQKEEEDMAETICTVTIIFVTTREGIIVLSTPMKSVVCMEDIHGAIVYTTHEGKLISELPQLGLLP